MEHTEYVVLVDAKDRELGLMEKMEAHRKGCLHRAFSVFVFNSKNELLLQRRAFSKYHSGGLWTNTCCSHPRKGESCTEGAHRRLQEEMGFTCALKHAFSFTYRSALNNGLIEHEFDHVFMGHFDGEPAINKTEVEEWKPVAMEVVRKDMHQHPDHYTVWFRIVFDRMEAYISGQTR